MDKGEICQRTDLIRVRFNARRNERKSHREENVHDKKCRDAREHRKRKQREIQKSWYRKMILKEAHSLRVRKKNMGKAARNQRNIRYREREKRNIRERSKEEHFSDMRIIRKIERDNPLTFEIIS